MQYLKVGKLYDLGQREQNEKVMFLLEIIIWVCLNTLCLRLFSSLLQSPSQAAVRQLSCWGFVVLFRVTEHPFNRCILMPQMKYMNQLARWAPGQKTIISRGFGVEFIKRKRCANVDDYPASAMLGISTLKPVTRWSVVVFRLGLGRCTSIKVQSRRAMGKALRVEQSLITMTYYQ